MKKTIKTAAVILALIILTVSVSLLASAYHASYCDDGQSEFVVTHFSINGSHCRLCQLSLMISVSLRHLFESDLFAVLLCVFISFALFARIAVYTCVTEKNSLTSLKIRLND